MVAKSAVYISGVFGPILVAHTNSPIRLFNGEGTPPAHIRCNMHGSQVPEGRALVRVETGSDIPTAGSSSRARRSGSRNQPNPSVCGCRRVTREPVKSDGSDCISEAVLAIWRIGTGPHAFARNDPASSAEHRTERWPDRPRPQVPRRRHLRMEDHNRSFRGPP